MPILKVRGVIWGIFGIVLCFALSVPLVNFYQQWQAPVVASFAFEPAQPIVGQPMRLIVTLNLQYPDQAQQSRLEVNAEMPAMPMGFSKLTISNNGSAFQAPIQFTMSGQWQIDVHLDVPAHATWDKQLTVTVQTGGTA